MFAPTRLVQSVPWRPPHWRALALALVLALAGIAPVRGAAVDETSVKAAVLYNLMPFITWPTDALGPGDDLRLCLHEEGALYNALRAYHGKLIRGNLLIIQRVADTPEALRRCHALMVEGGHPARLARAAAVAAGQPLLVIGEGSGTAQRGAMVGINIEGGRVVFEIDLGAMRRARLFASSRLLSLARTLIE